MKNTKTQRLVLSAIMIALAAGLSLIKVFQMPLGGSVTLLSMLPIALLSIRYGVKHGLFCSFVYFLVQLSLDFAGMMGWGMTFSMWIGSIVFDYLLAFGALGLSGLFRRHGAKGICAGIALAMGLRWVCHVISGSIFFVQWCPEGWNPVLYSICYNGLFMSIELVFTVIAAFILVRLPHVGRFFAPLDLENGKSFSGRPANAEL